MKIEKKNKDEATLFDRFAVGGLSAFLAALTSGLAWWSFGFVGSGHVLPIGLFLIFTGTMFLVGFFTLDNYFIDILAPIWDLIVKLSR